MHQILLWPQLERASVLEMLLWGILQMHWDGMLCPVPTKPPASLLGRIIPLN